MSTISSVKRCTKEYQIVDRPKRKNALRVHLGQFFLRIILPLVLLFSLTAQSTLAQDGLPKSPAELSAAWNIQFVDASPYIDKMTSRSLAFRPSG